MADGEVHDFNREAFEYYGKLGRVRRHLEDHISQPLSVPAAAHVAGLNPNYFSSFFHAKVGVPFTAWSRYVRIEFAKRALASFDHAIGDVAVQVGYRDLRTFERAFKRVTAMTPSEYKRRVRPEGRAFPL